MRWQAFIWIQGTTGQWKKNRLWKGAGGPHCDGQ